MGRSNGSHTVAGDGALIVQWHLADGSDLTLWLNLSRRTARAEARPAGTLIYCEPPSALDAFNAGELSPESAAYLS